MTLDRLSTIGCGVLLVILGVLALTELFLAVILWWHAKP